MQWACFRVRGWFIFLDEAVYEAAFGVSLGETASSADLGGGGNYSNIQYKQWIH